QRMPHEFVRSRRAEFQRRVRFAEKLQPHLPQSEKIEVIDEERRHENECPTKREERAQRDDAGGILDRPYKAAERTPLPEHQNERSAREENVRRALELRRHDA